MKKLITKKCAYCGKNFSRVTMTGYVYKDEHGNYYCSWDCYRKGTGRRPMGGGYGDYEQKIIEDSPRKNNTVITK